MEAKELSNSTKSLNIISMLTLLVGFFFIGFLGFNLIYPKTNLELKNVTVNGITHNQDTHVQHKQLIRGSNIDFIVEVCKLTNVPITITAELFDGIKDVVPLLEKTSQTAAGCGNLIVSANLPTVSPLGGYNLKITIMQEINYLRKTSDSIVIEGFEVVKENHE